MNSKDTASQSNTTGISEFIPSLNKFVDLSDPESMSRDELLQVFERHGFESLVSKTDPLDRIVSLYYDHIMPMPARSQPNFDSPASTSPLENHVTDRTNSPSDPPKRTKFSESSLDNIIITNDPKRLTPGIGPLPNSKDERTLTVKLPDQHRVRNRTSALRRPVPACVNDVNHGSNSEPNDNHCDDRHPTEPSKPTATGDSCSDVVPKKRIKLNREFKALV